MALLGLRIAIIGGGITGLTLATALHKRGFCSVTIYEQASAFGEIGAGVSFQSNAIQSMKVCDPAIYAALQKIQSKNSWQTKESVWFDFYDALHDTYAFTSHTKLGQCGVHRAEFLDELVRLIPGHYARFEKCLRNYEENDDGTYILEFADGSRDVADVILACDGIKSRVRACMFGEESEYARPTFTGKCAFRALVPMEKARKAIGDDMAQNAKMHLGPEGHVLTFPINGGQTMNIVAYKTITKPPPSQNRSHERAKRETVLEEFEGFGKTVTTILQDLVPPELDIWAIFDTYDHPPPTFAMDRVCLLGDAAHASSPHLGAGSGICIEDVAVLAELLGDSRVKTRQDVAQIFSIFDRVRQKRARWLTRTSRHVGECYHWRAPDIGSNFSKIEREIGRANQECGEVDVQQMCRDAMSYIDCP